MTDKPVTRLDKAKQAPVQLAPPSMRSDDGHMVADLTRQQDPTLRQLGTPTLQLQDDSVAVISPAADDSAGSSTDYSEISASAADVVPPSQVFSQHANIR